MKIDIPYAEMEKRKIKLLYWFIIELLPIEIFSMQLFSVYGIYLCIKQFTFIY